jgi:hypothetical protein
MVFTSIYFFVTDRSLKTNINNEKLKNETLLYERLAVEKEIAQVKATMQSLIGRNAEIESLLAATKIQLEDK